MQINANHELIQTPNPMVLLSKAVEEVRHVNLVAMTLKALSQVKPEGLLIMANAGDLGALLPSTIDPTTPLQVIAIPDDATVDIQGLATSRVQVSTRLSVDMLYCATFVGWSNSDIRVEAVDHEILWGDGIDNILRLFVTSKELILVTDSVDEDLMIALQVAHGSSGINYSPYRLWSDDELAEATALAKARGCEGPVCSMEEGEFRLNCFDYHAEKKKSSPLQSLQEFISKNM